jgi:hypothetical protein
MTRKGITQSVLDAILSAVFRLVTTYRAQSNISLRIDTVVVTLHTISNIKTVAEEWILA